MRPLPRPGTAGDVGQPDPSGADREDLKESSVGMSSIAARTGKRQTEKKKYQTATLARLKTRRSLVEFFRYCLFLKQGLM